MLLFIFSFIAIFELEVNILWAVRWNRLFLIRKSSNSGCLFAVFDSLCLYLAFVMLISLVNILTRIILIIKFIIMFLILIRLWVFVSIRTLQSRTILYSSSNFHILYQNYKNISLLLPNKAKFLSCNRKACHKKNICF